MYSLILFIRSFRKFKKEISKDKSNIKFSDNLDKINEFEYKITSQNNEDGIIEYIFKKIPNNKYFVEIGFDLYECNSLNLIKNGWNGELMDQNIEECLALKSLLKYFFPNSKTIVSNEKIEASGFRAEFSLDLGIRELIKGYSMINNSRYGNV